MNDYAIDVCDDVLLETEDDVFVLVRYGAAGRGSRYAAEQLIEPLAERGDLDSTL